MWWSRWRSDQAHLWVPGDHSFRARETDNEDIPKGREEGEEERQRNRWEWLLRWCHALWPQRDESPAVLYSQTFLLSALSFCSSLVCLPPSVLFDLRTKTTSFCIFHQQLDWSFIKQRKHSDILAFSSILTKKNCMNKYCNVMEKQEGKPQLTDYSAIDTLFPPSSQSWSIIWLLYLQYN